MKMLKTFKLIFTRLWRECNPKCAYYDVNKRTKCNLLEFGSAPTIKCLLVQLCFLLRQFEIDRERYDKEEREGEQWKDR